MNPFGYLTVASPLHDARTVDDVTRPVRRQLQAVGGTAVDTAAARPDQPLAILVGTGGTEAQILDLARQRQAAVPFEPVLLVAHPKHNSLPAALEALAALQADGARGRILQLDGSGGAADVDAITVRCFDYLGALGTSGCVALAQLNDTGIVAGCEGDLCAAVAMVLVRTLLGQPSWIANPASVDTAGDRVLLAHCTVAPSMVEGVQLHTHFESGIGVGLRGRFLPGPVTLLRLGGPALDRLWISEGEIEHAGDAEDLCRTQVLVRLDGTPAQSLLDAPLGNHLVLVHGHHRARIERWWRLAFGEAPDRPAMTTNDARIMTFGPVERRDPAGTLEAWSEQHRVGAGGPSSG